MTDQNRQVLFLGASFDYLTDRHTAAYLTGLPPDPMLPVMKNGMLGVVRSQLPRGSSQQAASRVDRARGGAAGDPDPFSRSRIQATLVRSSGTARDADAELYELLEEHGFVGPVWQIVSDHLARCGLASLRAWIPNLVFAKLVERGIDLRPSAVELARLSRDEVCEELAVAAVGTALARFRTAGLAGKGWRPGSASMATFFVGGCLLSFAEEFRAFRRQEQEWATHLRLDDPDVVAEAVLSRSEEEHAARDADDERFAEQIGAVLSTMDARDGQILLGKAARESNQAIAQKLGTTAKSVERRWSRLMTIYPWARELSRGRKPENS
ncbi:hypothetical protein [Nocardia noduli]|uniref:hypothetical protein n=1 Tax=Nocardia noduli TaxID=2815722 RepID=UPI001C21FB1D|nr:hypothetical protein [Nocardia noduli]